LLLVVDLLVGDADVDVDLVVDVGCCFDVLLLVDFVVLLLSKMNLVMTDDG
jgi:hypothetical protein